MASNAYFEWVSDGKPYVLTKPAKELELLLRGYGYTVYDYPNEDHQTAVPPEDHTPYSATEWPVAVSAYIAHALDIMPPDATDLARGAIPLPALARRIIADRDAKKPGTMFIKYMNWTDEHGVCRKESWKTTPRTTTSSTDRGHIHLSARTDTQGYSIGDWNPVMATVQIDPNDPNFKALIWRIEGLERGRNELAPGAGAYAGEDILTWARIALELKPQFDAILAQSKANGQALSELKAQVAELKALITTGGVDPEALATIVRDEVARLILATSLKLG